MDMCMDMDIPLPEELELLESISRFHQDFPDIEPPEPYSEDEHQPQTESPAQPFLSADLPLTPESPINNRKRLLSDSPDASILQNVGPSERKRSRTRDSGTETDDDWIRYSPPKKNRPLVSEQVSILEEKALSRFASEIEGDCIPVTAPRGDRVYAKICRFEGEERSKRLDLKTHSSDLLVEPINTLLQRLDQEAFTKALQGSSEFISDTHTVLPETLIAREQLWVDKYAPNSFTELLSDEQTNREVLLWLKQWDSCVFGSEIRSTPDDVLSCLKRHSYISQRQKPLDSNILVKKRGTRWSNGRFGHYNNKDENANPIGIEDVWNKKTKVLGPPEQKILLLCGPPGFGKTTLAHVAAKHCGYHVVEVNASDDRSSSTIESKILDVVQMNSVLSDSRPKCLVIDEIDGALGDGKGAVEVILKMVSSEKKPIAGKDKFLSEEQSARKSSKKGRKTAPLCRPVICICNDLYAPALRPLRQVAKVHMFVQPSVSRVVSRLKYICSKERMKTSAIALTALAEYTECDIRSCLNTLQFLNKKRENLNAFDISSQVVGQKDISRNVLDIWKEVFQRKRTKRERKSRTNRSGSISNGCDALYSLISNRGDSDLILDGIHDNILQLQYHDPVMQKTVKCFDILGISDLMHQHVMRTQQMSLQAYIPTLVVDIHRLVAQVQKPNIEWPKSYHRYRTMLMERIDVFKSWHSKIPPYIARHLSPSSLVEDLISPFLHILSPPALKPVALQLLSEREKNELAQVVSTMVSYSVTYNSSKSDFLPINPRNDAVVDDLVLSLDPPISNFINFKDYRSDHYVLSLAMKQVLVHEVEKQKILLANGEGSVHSTSGCITGEINSIEAKTGCPKSAKTNNGCAFAEKNLGNAKSFLETKQFNADTPIKSTNMSSSGVTNSNVKQLPSGSTGKLSRSSSSFFDRFRKPSCKGSLSNNAASCKEDTLQRDVHLLLFKFNEGFTNADKRPVRIQDFLSEKSRFK